MRFDPYAQLTVPKYNRYFSEEEKEKLYLSSIEKGLSNACYYAKFLDQKRFVANGMTVNIPSYGPKNGRNICMTNYLFTKKEQRSTMVY